MTAAIRSLRQDDVDARLRARIERLQKLIETDGLRSLGDTSSGETTPLATCYPPDPGCVRRIARRPLDGPAAAVAPDRLIHDGKHRPLLPFPLRT